MSLKLEHTVQFVDQQAAITYWATFYLEGASKIQLYEGAEIDNIAVHLAGVSVVTTVQDHGFLEGMTVVFDGVELVSPAVAGEKVVGVVVNSKQFKITASVTVVGKRGRVGRLLPHFIRLADVRSVAVGRFPDQRARDNDYYYS